jgi:hypothetical protein
MTRPGVFISYSDLDRDWAEAFARLLEESGADVWFDQWKIAAGQARPALLEKGFRESDVIAVVFDRTGPFRPDLWFEFGAAVGLGKRLVPIVPSGMPSSELSYPWRVRQGIPRETPEETAKKFMAAMQGEGAAEAEPTAEESMSRRTITGVPRRRRGSG